MNSQIGEGLVKMRPVEKLPYSDDLLKETGIGQFGYISTSEIVFGDEIRKICEGNVCRQYGASWACPPAVGIYEQCRSQCLSYDNAFVFNAIYPLEDSFDFEGMKRGHQDFKDVCDRLFRLVKSDIPRFLILSNEGCTRCERCTYPDLPCKIPDMLFPSVEGFGIYVNKLAASANIGYINVINTVTYFGLLLY